MNLFELVFVSGFFALWIFIAWQVGLRAAKKARRQGLWTLMAIFPLGPIITPLWLASLPVVGAQASTGQLIGRSALITLFVLSQAARLAQVAH